MLLLQVDQERAAANICAWMPDAPNVIHLYTGAKPIQEVRQSAEMAFKDSPPLRIDGPTIRELSDAAHKGVAFLEV